MSISYTPSASIYKKYKRYTTYKAKVIIVDGSSIKSVMFDEPFGSKEAAKNFAEQMIAQDKVTERLSIESS